MFKENSHLYLDVTTKNKPIFLYLPCFRFCLIIGLSYERPYLVLDLNSIMICMFFACV